MRLTMASRAGDSQTSSSWISDGPPVRLPCERPLRMDRLDRGFELEPSDRAHRGDRGELFLGVRHHRPGLEGHVLLVKRNVVSLRRWSHRTPSLAMQQEGQQPPRFGLTGHKYHKDAPSQMVS